MKGGSLCQTNLNHGNTILTLDADAPLETPQSKADLIWHEIQNAYRTRKILTGKLGGIEKTEAGNLIAIVYYKDFRAVIPIAEMMLNLVQDASHDYGELALRQNKILNNMLGCEIDFLVKGLDTKTRSIVASRKEAMLKKRPDLLSGYRRLRKCEGLRGPHRAGPESSRVRKGGPGGNFRCGDLHPGKRPVL